MRPRDLIGKTRHRLAAEQLADLVVIEQEKSMAKELKALVKHSGPT